MGQLACLSLMLGTQQLKVSVVQLEILLYKEAVLHLRILISSNVLSKAEISYA